MKKLLLSLALLLAATVAQAGYILTGSGSGGATSQGPTPQSKSANYTMTGTDSVIYASSLITAISTITLPSAAALNGQVVDIYKVDSTTMPVVILAASGQTIVGMSTVTLNAYGAHQGLRSDGSATWYPIGDIYSPPSFMGNNQDVASAATLVASTTYHQAWNLKQPCDTKSFSFANGVQSGKLVFTIHNAYGHLMVSSGPVTVPSAASNVMAIPRVNLQPGLYYIGFGFDNATATISRYMSNFPGGAYSKSNGIPIITELGNPPAFDNGSTRSPAITVQCYGGAP